MKEQIEALEKENAELKARIAELESAGTVKVDPRVRTKMAAGLSRNQAEEVVAAQEKADAVADKAEKNSKK